MSLQFVPIAGGVRKEVEIPSGFRYHEAQIRMTRDLIVGAARAGETQGPLATARAERSLTDATRIFHEETNNSPDRRRGPRKLEFTRNAPDNLPLTFKEYEGLTAVELSLHALSRRTGRAVDTLSRPGARGPNLDGGALARVLAFSGGITRIIDRSPRRKRYCRAASSAHSYPDIYVVCGDLDGIDAGVYYFHGLHLRLDRLRSGDFRSALAIAAADGSIARRAASVVIVGVPWRAASHYGERALRHVYWDTGGLLANMVAVTDADGIEARIDLGFVDADVAALVGADGVHQVPVALATFGPERAHAPAAPEVRPLAMKEPPISTGQPIVFPLVVDAHRSGNLSDSDAVTAWRSARSAACGSFATAIEPPPGHRRSIEEVILRRGSTRRMLPDTLPRIALEWPLAAAARPAPGDWVDEGKTLLEHFAIVHAIDDVRPGLYRYRRGGLEPIREGDLRQDARIVSLGQGQGGDGAYTTFHFADLDRVIGALGSRGYRAAQIEGGYVLERLHLTAFALGVGATGLTFYDDAVSTLCGTTSAVMTEVAVGKPAYRAKRGGLGKDTPTIAGRAMNLYMERMQELEEARQSALKR